MVLFDTEKSSAYDYHLPQIESNIAMASSIKMKNIKIMLPYIDSSQEKF